MNGLKRCGVCIHIHTCMHTVEYYSAINKNGILHFATIWMDLELTMFNEESQTKTNTLLPFVCEM